MWARIISYSIITGNRNSITAFIPSWSFPSILARAEELFSVAPRIEVKKKFKVKFIPVRRAMLSVSTYAIPKYSAAVEAWILQGLMKRLQRLILYLVWQIQSDLLELPGEQKIDCFSVWSSKFLQYSLSALLWTTVLYRKLLLWILK